MSVLTQHPDYTTATQRWHLIRSICNSHATEFIRTPDVNDPVRTSQYKESGVLTNFTNLTKVGLTGLVFRKDPMIVLPTQLDYLNNNLTGTGINIYQFSQHAIGELLEMGRYGFMVDKDEGGKTFIRPYIAENIRNWKTKNINGECVLSLLVLQEYTFSEENMFSQDFVKRYRVLYLDEQNIYRQEVYSYSDRYALNDGYNITENYTPLDFNGKPLNRIQFVFAGSANNDWDIDQQPLYDLAQVNLAHYRCSCDQMEAVWLCGQPYLVINPGETTAEDFNAVNPSGVQFGSRKGLVLANGGSAQLLQSNPNQMVGEVMKELLIQAAAIGARLIAPAGGRETAEAAKIRYGSQHSSLYTLTSNYTWAIIKALEMVCVFEGADPAQIVFELNDEFYDEIADPNMAAQLIVWMQNGVISVEDLREYGRRTGIIPNDKTDEEIQQAIDTSSAPLMGITNVLSSRNSTSSTPIDAAGTDTGTPNY